MGNMLRVAGLGDGVTVRPSILGTSFCGFSVVHMRTWKEVARHVTGGYYKPQELRDNGILAQLGNAKREGKTHDEYWQQRNREM